MNLFDVHTDCQDKLASKPRKATDEEVAAYANFLRERRGLPDMGAPDLHFCESRSGGGRRGYERGHCIGATFGKRTAAPVHVAGRWEGGDYFPGVSTPAQYETGAYSIAFPGHDMHRQVVTFEALGEGGEVLSSQTLPVEPKKGGVIWSRDDIRAAFGPIARKGKGGKVADAPTPVQPEAPAPAMPEICPPEAAESDCAPDVTQGCGEAPDALHGADLPPHEPVTAADELPAPATVKESLTAEPLSDAQQLPDPVAELAARVAALEARLAALPAESAATPSGEVARPKRTAAHERAIRRAWAERKARRGAQGGMAIHARRIDALEVELRLAKNDQALDRQALSEVYARAEQFARRGNQHRDRRQASARRARRMIAASRKAARFQEQRADVLAAQLAKIKHDMADPTQPERASDLARLVQERDQARTALAATDARNRTMKAALDDLADKFEAMASRLAVAEAAARRGAIAV